MGEAAVTVVMPAYNAARTVGTAIESVLAQTRADFELLVVDDGSADDTAEQVAGYEADNRVRLLRREHVGLAAARNAAIRASSAPLVSMLDSDDLWLPQYLETMVEALAASPDAGLAYTDAWVLDDATRRIRRTTAMAYQDPPDPPPAEPRAFLEELLRANFVFSGATVRRAALDSVGLFNEKLAAGEDYELWLRIVAHGFRAVRPPGLLAVYRKSPGTLSTNEKLMFSGMREVYRTVAEEYDVPEEIRRLAQAQILRTDRRLAAIAGDRGLLPALGRLRPPLIRLKFRLLDPFLWYARPPAEVASAFPDVFSGPSVRP